MAIRTGGRVGLVTCLSSAMNLVRHGTMVDAEVVDGWFSKAKDTGSRVRSRVQRVGASWMSSAWCCG